jgi:ATP-binding cassette subfamily B protein
VNVFIVVFAFGLMFIYNWKLALIISAILPLYGLIYGIINHLNKRQERKIMIRTAEVESQLVESLNSMKTIKQFGLEGFANIRTETRFISLLRSIYTSGMNSIFSNNASGFLNRSFTIILLWVGSYFVIDRLITAGELLSFYALLGYFTGPAISLVSMNKTIQNALIAADRLFEIMDLEREESGENLELEKDMVGDVHFEGVSFSYGTRTEVFDGLNLTIEMGKITAIVGESGSGKSTITYLLQKLYPLKKGKIRIGNYNIQQITNESLRRIIGSVPQQLNIFSGTVAENIAIGDAEPDMRRMVGICSKLGILGFIEQLPDGFGTWLGENGASLSGGQKQRIAIARSLYRSPRILILDEAMSNLDSESEAIVQKVLHDLRDRGLTVLMITHRLSSLAGADRIVVLDKGKVVEQGTHQELYNRAGKYYRLWQKQIPAFLN